MTTFTLSAKDEIQLIVWAAKALSKDKTRFVLMGFGISTIEDQKSLCATDGGRAHWIPCPEALKELPDGSCLSKVALNKTTCVLTLVEGTYPNISQVVPSKKAFNVYKEDRGDTGCPHDSFVIAAHHVDTGRLLETRKVADLFSGGATLLRLGTPKENKAGPCRFSFSGDRSAIVMPARESRG